ncbi:hypothetical protein OAG20_01715 [Verrucomicrobiales bacterium]|nr:hypothetical protein [Verrucomicrobiales bacterium]
MQKVVQPDGVVTYQLLCESECPDGGKCDPHRSQNQHGGIREWCSCGEEEPPHCHIVLYTPGRGEGGGPQQVFCSGQCPDGQPCRLSEQLIHKGDGFQVFHLVCACYGDHGNPNHSSGENDGKPADPTDPDQEVPDPTNPGNDPDTGNEEPVPSEQDSVNPEPDGSIQDNDDPCCGDNNKKDCKGIVQKIVQPNGIVTYQLLCDGICPDRAKCETRSSKNHHGGVREWCGCSDTEPSTCHIVIYTYGDSEPGTGQEVFCAGACPDGTACKLQEKLVRNVNGFKFFHISCECPNGDGGNANNGDDNQSNNNSDGTPNNSDDNDDTQDASNADGNDDDCCGDDAPGAAKPCKGYVQKVVQNNGRVTYQLVCGGDCPGRAKCEPRSSRNHHGGVRQWCGCNDTEPRTCHIVLYTPGPGEGGGAQKVFCAGACPDGSECTIKELRKLKTADGNKVYHLTCDCGKPAEGGDDAPNDDSMPDDPTQPNGDDTDASSINGGDNDCCGDDASGAARPCKGYVQKIVQSNGIVTYQLICGGDCPGRAKCERRSSRNHHGGVRQWCGCDKVEPSTCHIVLYTQGPGEGGGRQEVICAGVCPDGSKCAIKTVLVHRTKGGSKVFRITCDCKKAAAGAGVATALQTDGEVTGPTDETAFLTELDPDFVLEDDQETRSELKQQAQAITMLVQTEPLPTRDEKFYQLTFEGVPESLYEVLVSEDMQLWQRAGTAEEIESGHYGWADDAAMDHAPRFYTIRTLYVQRVEDLEEQN